MKYNEVKGANRIVKNSSYLISKPYELKNRWRNEFNNNNPNVTGHGKQHLSQVFNLLFFLGV